MIDDPNIVMSSLDLYQRQLDARELARQPLMDRIAALAKHSDPAKRLLAVLASGRPSGRFAEIGTGTGVGSAWIASAMGPEATLVTVELDDEDSGDSVTYQIVGDIEADIKQRLIAVSSPIARALIGKSQGDSFEFQAPNGVKHYEITAVRYD